MLGCVVRVGGCVCQENHAPQHSRQYEHDAPQAHCAECTIVHCAECTTAHCVKCTAVHIPI